MNAQTGIAFFGGMPRLVWRGHDVTIWAFLLALSAFFFVAGVYGLAREMSNGGQP